MEFYSVTARSSASWTTIADSLMPMDHDYHGSDRWSATMSVQESVGYRLLHWDQQGARTSSRTRTHIHRIAGDDFYWIVFPEEGTYTVRYRGGTVTSAGPGRGAVTVLDTVCHLQIPRSSAYAFQVPRTEIDGLAGLSGTRTAELDMSSGLGRITRTLIRRTHSEQGALTEREFDAVCQRIGELLCMLSIGEVSPQQSQCGEVTEQVRRYIRTHIGHRDIRLPAVAAALGWSPRQVRTILYRSGTTFRDLRQAEAMRAACAFLENPAYSAVPIGDLAARCGFNPSWFSTAFKEAMGETPREFRQRRRSELATAAAGDEFDNGRSSSCETPNSVPGRAGPIAPFPPNG
ncbi:AraC family transcriptional regulator [Nocardia carnea]|uniref:AraC family transcriptional regulator n=1 Tax=Nocardia carnea TaxID=37328 RepID=UPI002456328E|nr:AraC family transcriptional regulator [Nocardia carnea]